MFAIAIKVVINRASDAGSYRIFFFIGYASLFGFEHDSVLFSDATRRTRGRRRLVSLKTTSSSSVVVSFFIVFRVARKKDFVVIVVFRLRGNAFEISSVPSERS